MGHQGTLLRCDCCGQETLAGANEQLEVRDRRHGTMHKLTLTIQDLVRMLDPSGTAYVAVGSAR